MLEDYENINYVFDKETIQSYAVFGNNARPFGKATQFYDGHGNLCINSRTDYGTEIAPEEYQEVVNKYFMMTI